MCMGKGSQFSDILKTTTLGGNPMANLAIGATILGGMGLPMLAGAGAGAAGAGAGAAGDAAGSALLNAGAGAMDAGGFAGMGMSGPAMSPIPLDSPIPIDPSAAFGTMGPGVNPYVGGGSSMFPSLTGKQMVGMGSNMLQQGMKPPQPSPAMAQRPPGMQQQQPGPGGVQGMLNTPMQQGVTGGANDVMARLRAMGLVA